MDAGSKSRSRTSSISSDSQLSRVNLMSPPSARPPPAFISSSAASEIITSDQEFNAADFVAEDEETGAAADALVTPAALSLLNGFLDNLLFNILAASRSTQMTAIRPAVADVLKPRLAGEVVATADEELSEYMGGEEDEQTEFRGGRQPAGDFDLIRSWKLTRLRCMVYTRLGDMEEEDEDEIIAQEGLGESDGTPRRFSSHVDNITPAAAIFLTSIIEHIGERSLVIAGETARSRLSAKLNDGEDESGESDDRKRIEHLVVEDLDMEKLALNATLGRLWRTWRKRRRGSAMMRSLSRAESRESFRRRGQSLVNSRKSSIVTIEEPVTPEEVLPEEVNPADVPLPVDPEDVPLPMSEYDVQEIEVPGYSADLDGEVQTMEAVVAHKVRPRSLMVFSSPALSRSSPGSRSASPVSASIVEIAKTSHIRSRSLPNTPSREVPPESVTEDQPSPSASEKNRQLETMYEDDESAEFVDAAESAPGIAITTASDDLQVPLAEKARMSIVHEEDEETAPPVNETIASLRTDTHDDTDQSSSVRVPEASIDESPTQDPEVIEGQGMCEKPTLASAISRPKRRSMRDSALLEAKAIVATTSETETEIETEPVMEAPPTQGTEPASATSATSVEVVEAVEPPVDVKVAPDGDRIKEDAPITPATEAVVPVKEDVVPEEPQAPTSPQTPRPASASGDSERSQRSHGHKPSPLLVAANNRSSPRTAERASVQRMPRPSTSVPSPPLPSSRRSESFSSARDKRPVTSSSATSQVSSKLKGLMGRPQAESPSFRVRSSSETSRASGSAESADNETTDLDLDRLINSDETIHYTLTPRSVREMTFPEITRPPRRSDAADTSDLAELLKTTGPPREDVSRSRASVSSKATSEVTSLGRSKPSESLKHTTISYRMSMSPKHSPVGQARDARAQQGSTREFADFLKSSGPTSASYETASSPVETKPARPPSTFSTSTTRSNRPRLQARPADTKSSHTSDLIDFLREGPPQSGAHRIPRTVAPFRNTVDSDDLQQDSAKHETTRSSLARSTPDGSTSNKSLPSLGSRTGLLDSTNRVNGQTNTTSVNATAFDDARPPRKQHRVPDPYAIDDDEDDDYLEELVNGKSPQREEESLIDFLRSAPPPEFETPPPQPVTVNSPSSSSSFNAFVSSSASSASDMKHRILRGNADRVPSSKISTGSLRSQSTVGGPQSPSSYATKVSRERHPGTIPSSTHRQTETSALADFLRNTGPPEPPANRATPVNPKAKEGSFTRFFARRRKVEA